MQVHPVLPGSIQFSPLQTSLHPSLHLTYNATSSRPSDHLLGTACHPAGQSCSLSFQFTFPDALFLDRNELRDTFVGSEEVEHWHLAPETIDIERPVANNQEPNVLRLHLGDEGEGEVKIPLHARYLVPREEGLEEVWLFAAGESGAVHGGWVCTPSESSGEYNIAHSRTFPKLKTKTTADGLSSVSLNDCALVYHFTYRSTIRFDRRRAGNGDCHLDMLCLVGI